MKDAESQTMHSSQNHVNSGIPGPRGVRPSGLPAAFAPRAGGIRAPLAISETASELGTPTPMDENKAFGKPYPSSASVTGQFKPLSFSGQAKIQLVYPPKLPTPTSSMPAVSPSVSSAPSASHIPGPISRPKGPVPLPPVRSVAAPNSLPASGRNGTDNVPVTSVPYTTISGTAANPAYVQRNVHLAAKEQFSKQRSTESVKATAMGVDGISVESGPIDSGRVRSRTENVISSTSSSSSIPISTSKLTGPKSGLRPPASSVGSAPRGPLALGTQKQAPGPVPTKPVRKSPQSAAVNELDMHYVNSLPTGPDPSPALFYQNQEALRHLHSANHPSVSSVPVERFSGLSLDGAGYRDSFLDDHDYFAGGEAFAERPKQFSVDEYALKDMIATLVDAKSLAEELLVINEKSSLVLSDNLGRKVKDKASISAVKEDEQHIRQLLLRPSEDTFRDPKKALDLILQLQDALRSATGL
ncbi:uncharacterized protein LOC129600483 isoform X2 [Paramacrobiotus metropolitanus]|nr:uncharacterized protein LOC129600483 isoform X2 [Paramacrobiotus metropolitanus]